MGMGHTVGYWAGVVSAVLMGLFAAGCRRVEPQRQLVNMDLFAGWNGVAKGDGWVPVRVEVNLPEGFVQQTGTLRVSAEGSGCSSVYEAALTPGGHVVRECLIAMDWGSTPKVHGSVATPSGIGDSREVRLGRVLSDDQRLGVGIGGVIPGFSSVSIDLEEESGFGAMVAVEPRFVYREWGAWLGVDAVWLPLAGAMGLDADQWVALRQWVMCGGILVVAPGPGWGVQWELLQAAGLVEVGASAPAVAHVESGLSWYVADGDSAGLGGAGWMLTEGVREAGALSSAWFTRPGDDEVWEAWTSMDVGLGSLRIWNAFPEVWSSGQRTRRLWVTALSPRPGLVEQEEAETQNNQWFPIVTTAVQSMLARGWTPGLGLGWILPILGLYLFVVAYVDYKLVFRLRRPVLTWFTLPAWSGAACLLIVLGGNWYYGDLAEGRGLCLWQSLDPEATLIRSTRYLLLEQPSNRRDRISGQGLIRPSQLGVSSGWRASEVRFGGREETGTVWEGMMERWVKRLFREDALLVRETPLVAVASDSEGIRLTPDSNWSLAGGYLVRGEEYWELSGDEFSADTPGQELNLLMRRGEGWMQSTNWPYSEYGNYGNREPFTGNQLMVMVLTLSLGRLENLYGNSKVLEAMLPEVRSAHMEGRGVLGLLLNVEPGESGVEWRAAGGGGVSNPVREQVLFFHIL